MNPRARLLCALAAPALPAMAQPPGPADPRPTAPPVRIIIDRSLQETAARLTRIRDATLDYTPVTEPADAPAHRRALSEVLAIAPVWGGAQTPRPVSREAAPLVAVTTIDGQRFVGHVREPVDADRNGADDGPPLVVESALFGRIVLSLDDVSSIELLEAVVVGAPTPGRDDTILLTNGDRIDGFVESIGPSVTIKSPGADSATTIPLDRTTLILLANPAKAPSGTVLWLADGSVVALGGLPEYDGQSLTGVRRHGSVFSAPMAAVGAIAVEARLIRPLGALPPPTFTPAPERRWTRPPSVVNGATAALGAADIEVPGPMSVEWVLPTGASRLAGTAELARSAQGWGDCEVIIEHLAAGAPARRLFARRLTADDRSARFDVALAPGPGEHRLRIAVEAGQRGPVQDRVILRRPLLLVGDGTPATR